MKNLNCKNCGGTMVLDASAMTAVCHYCGTKYILNHEDTDYFRSFYSQMKKFFSASEEEQDRKLRADKFWEESSTQVFTTKDGKEIEINYKHRYTDKDAEIYVSRRNIVFHFISDGISRTEKFRNTISFIDYPSADTRNLSNFFPKFSGGFELADETYLMVISKDEDEYPLRLFGTLGARHVAWIISRLENLCCVLEYNGLVHPEISLDTVYINPYNHTASLYGNWWKVGKANTFSENKSILNMKQNLLGLRNTAANLLGYDTYGSVKASEKIPKALADFINSVPRENAYEDFEYWDKMLISAFGERKFIKMETDDEEVYGNQ